MGTLSEDVGFHYNGMAHLLARISRHVKDAESRSCIKSALADFCRLNPQYEVVPGAMGFCLERRPDPQ